MFKIIQLITATIVKFLGLRLICVFFLSSSCLQVLNAQSCAIATSLLNEASKLRGLSVRRSVPCQLEEKEQVKKFMLDTIETKLPPKRLQHEELVYKTIGLIPEDYNYEKGLVDLYVGQIGGYYDPSKKRYIMAAWLPDLMQPTIAVHELTHALQDQHYDLEAMTDFKKFGGDELLAHSALIEGDATAVMYDYTRALTGMSGLRSEENVNSILMQNALGASLMSGLSGAPQSLQLLMLFPYSSGLRFVHYFLRKGGYSKIDKILKQPPRSTEEILHPEKYGSFKADFLEIKPESLQIEGLPPGYSKVYEDVLGEFAISVLMGQQLADNQRGSSIGAGWGGDRLAIFQSADATESHLIWRIHWDSLKDAQEFRQAWEQVSKKRFGLNSISWQGSEVVLKSGSRSTKAKFKADAENIEMQWQVTQ